MLVTENCVFPNIKLIFTFTITSSQVRTNCCLLKDTITFAVVRCLLGIPEREAEHW